MHITQRRQRRRLCPALRYLPIGRYAGTATKPERRPQHFGVEDRAARASPGLFKRLRNGPEKLRPDRRGLRLDLCTEVNNAIGLLANRFGLFASFLNLTLPFLHLRSDKRSPKSPRKSLPATGDEVTTSGSGGTLDTGSGLGSGLRGYPPGRSDCGASEGSL